MDRVGLGPRDLARVGRPKTPQSKDGPRVCFGSKAEDNGRAG